MHYRKLRELEIATFVDERAVYTRWQAYAAYARRIYGPRAARVVVSGDLVYNDETDVPRITQLDVFAADGSMLAPDWTSDYWQTLLGERHADVVAQPWDPHDWRDPRTMALFDALSQLPVPPRCDDFDLTIPPPRRFPALYVVVASDAPE